MGSSEAGPWQLLPKALGTSASPTCLLIAAFGLILHDLGNRAIDRIFPGAPAIPAVSADLNSIDSWMMDHADDPIRWAKAATRLIVEPPRVWFGPFRAVFNRDSTGGEVLHGGLAGTWGLVVWSILGAAIARRSLIRLTGSTGATGMNASLAYAGRRSISLTIASIVPSVLIGLIALGMAGFGFLARHLGIWLAGLLGFLPTLGGLATATLLLILAGGWPLMVSAVAAEDEDGFDAFSRAASYCTQRPLEYLYFLAIAGFLGIVGASAVAGFLMLAFGLEGWGLSIGSAIPAPPGAIPVWPGVVRLLALGYVFAYPWAAWPTIYLILRRRIDGPDWDDIASDGA
ncbi:MAG: hypothetical protein U0800_01535 [Isosphaeraceae bacterium]